MALVGNGTHPDSFGGWGVLLACLALIATLWVLEVHRS